MSSNGKTPDPTWFDRHQTLLSELPSELSAKISSATSSIMREELAGSSEGWKVYTLEDAYAPRPPVEYIVSSLFPLPSLSIVYGAPGTLKSMVLADMAMCVATGQPWLEPLPGNNDVVPRATLQAPVLWCDFDNGTTLMHERMEALARAHNVPPDAPFYYVSMPTPWLDASNPESVDVLIEHIERVGAKLVIIDNLGTISGDADENSAAMVQVLANLRRVAEVTGAAIIVIHHTRKTTGKNGRAGESLRGHSSIEAALDMALLVERAGASMVNLRSTKTRRADVPSFAAMFTYQHKLGTDELETARFFGLLVEGSAGKGQVDDVDIERAVRETVGIQSPINKTKLKNAVKGKLPSVGINRIGGVIENMALKGQLVEEEGKNEAKLYSLPAEEPS